MEEKRQEKIYITCLHLKHGGVEMAITLLANALSKRGFPVEILCIYNFGEPAYKLNEKIKVTYLSSVQPNRAEFSNAVKNKDLCGIIREGIRACRILYLKKHVMIQAIKTITSGIIISTRNEHSVLLSKYGNKDVKKIAQLHHDHEFKKKLLKDFKSRYGNIDIFVLLTDLLKREIEQVMESNLHTKLTVIPNFLADMPDYSEEERKNQVVAVGRLHEVKGFLRLLDVWSKVDKKNKVILKIIGDGDQKSDIESRIRQLQLEESVVLTGAMAHDKVMEEMRHSQVYAMTSRTEAFPFVLIEAMYSGLPVIAYDVRVGPAAIVHDGHDGYLVPDNNEEEFVSRLESLLEDGGKRREMSENAKDTAKHFSEEIVMKKWLDILEG